ncbi:hypothetical protein M1N58_03375, partial [Dehalococcoidales bacterium]|nr:hypothetical protein [Dehalococcoidales bacterium]
SELAGLRVDRSRCSDGQGYGKRRAGMAGLERPVWWRTTSAALTLASPTAWRGRLPAGHGDHLSPNGGAECYLRIVGS